MGSLNAAYDYRAFGEQVDLTVPADKVTETFTGKEKDDETELNYFGARYLNPMLGLWVSADPKRQFASPYLYAGNGVNPVNGVDPDGNKFAFYDKHTENVFNNYVRHLSPEAEARYKQLEASEYVYTLQKMDENFNDPDFNDDRHFLGGLAGVYDNKGTAAGAAIFTNGRYFLHEVLQHLFDYDNALRKTDGDIKAAQQEYKNSEGLWEQRAEDFADEVNMPGVDIDEY